jgi:holo-[acyl-carrier protein] synthase
VIVGMGVDLCEVARIEKAIAAPHGLRFIERVFTESEIAYADAKANRAERYAARFAAKEAGMKALGTGWKDGVGWHQIEVLNLSSGKPILRLHGRAGEIAAGLGVRSVSLSMSHTREQAIALVVLEGEA